MLTVATKNRMIRTALGAGCILFFTILVRPPVALSATPDANSPEPPKSSRVFSPINSVTIEITISDEVLAMKTRKSSAWETSCSTLASAFRDGYGLWESGPAGPTTCKLGDKTATTKGKKTAEDFNITVRIAKAGDSIGFWIGTNLPAIPHKKSRPVLTIPSSEWAPEFLSEQEFASLIAYALLDSSPILNRLDPSKVSLKGGELRVSMYKEQRFTARKFQQVDPLQNIVFYRLERDSNSGRLFATHLGDGKLIEVEKIKIKAGSGAAPRTFLVPSAKYSFDQKLKDNFDTGTKIWIHSPEGAGAQGKKMAAAINEAHERLMDAARSGLLNRFFSKGYDSISDLLFQTAASGYVGLRYGTQLLKGDKLLENAAMYGLLVEIGSGPLNGLKFYYDKFPKTTYVSGESTLDMEWSKFVLGKSFSFKFPIFFNRVEVTPKLGRYYLTTTQPIEFDDSGTATSTQKFVARDQPSFSLEFSAERIAKHYTGRVWYALDRAISFLPVLGTSAVSAQRMGADLFVNSGLQFRSFGVDYSLNILGFTSYENLKIEDLKAGELAPGEVAVSAIQLRSAYAGLGLVINW